MTRLSLGLLLLGGALGGFAIWRAADGTFVASAAVPPPPQRVPVTTAVAAAQDVGVFLDGLGTVQAFNTVEIKAQVSGNLMGLPAREGQEVHKGDVVAVIDPRPYKAALDQATAQRDEDVAQLRSAQLDLKRYQSLARSSFAPVQQVDDQQATVSKETAAIAADTAAMETAQINLGHCVIRAPIDGRVSLYQLDVGNLVEVASQTGIISITQDKPISVVFTLPENDLVRIQDAQASGSLAVEVVDTGGQKTLAAGKLLAPNNTIDTNSGTISLKAEFDNQDDHLWPGEFVNTRLQVETLHRAVTVPAAAVQHGPDGLFVYLLRPDQTVATTAVQVGYQDDGRVVVTKGLTAAQTVVVSGQSRLEPGTRVTATDGAQAPPAAAGQSADGSASPG